MKYNKIEEAKVCLGLSLLMMINEKNNVCYATSSDIYCQASVKHVEAVLAKDNIRLPIKCLCPFTNGYLLEMDVTQELKYDNVQYYQKLIGILRWAVEIGCIYILLEVSLLSQYLALPR